MSEMPDNIPADLEAALRAVRGEKKSNDDDVFHFNEDTAFPVTSEILNAPRLGYQYKDEGIFIGEWRPVDRKGKSLGKVFNVFAAPEDLINKGGRRLESDFRSAVEAVAELEAWHGFDGNFCSCDGDVYAMLKSDRYKGGWFIPTKDMMGALCSVYKTGDMAGTLVGADHRASHAYPGWYWTCTEDKGTPPCVYGVQLETLTVGVVSKNSLLFACRPVRVVEIKNKTR